MVVILRKPFGSLDPIVIIYVVGSVGKKQELVVSSFFRDAVLISCLNRRRTAWIHELAGQAQVDLFPSLF